MGVEEFPRSMKDHTIGTTTRCCDSGAQQVCSKDYPRRPEDYQVDQSFIWDLMLLHKGQQRSTFYFISCQSTQIWQQLPDKLWFKRVWGFAGEIYRRAPSHGLG